jgi:hypothetical protein
MKEGAHGFGGLSTVLHPLNGAMLIDLNLIRGGMGIVPADLSQELAGGSLTGIGDGNTVKGAVCATLTCETDDNGQELASG